MDSKKDKKNKEDTEPIGNRQPETSRETTEEDPNDENSDVSIDSLDKSSKYVQTSGLDVTSKNVDFNFSSNNMIKPSSSSTSMMDVFDKKFANLKPTVDISSTMADLKSDLRNLEVEPIVTKEFKDENVDRQTMVIKDPDDNSTTVRETVVIEDPEGKGKTVQEKTVTESPSGRSTSVRQKSVFQGANLKPTVDISSTMADLKSDLRNLEVEPIVTKEFKDENVDRQTMVIIKDPDDNSTTVHETVVIEDPEGKGKAVQEKTVRESPSGRSTSVRQKSVFQDANLKPTVDISSTMADLKSDLRNLEVEPIVTKEFKDENVDRQTMVIKYPDDNSTTVRETVVTEDPEGKGKVVQEKTVTESPSGRSTSVRQKFVFQDASSTVSGSNENEDSSNERK